MTWTATTACTFYRELVCGAPGQFPLGNLTGLLSKSIGKCSGTPMINSKMETLRILFKLY